MARDATLTKMLMGGAALIAAGTAAQAMSLGTSGDSCVLGSAMGGPIGAAVGALVGFGSSFAGGWMSNRFHERYKALEYALNDPSDVLRNHYLRRLVTQAIRLGVRQGIEGSIKDQETIKALRDLEKLAVSLFEQDSEVADRLNLNEMQLERFFTGRWEDLDRVDRPNVVAWRAFLERAAGNDASSAMTLAIGIAADTLAASFTRLLFDNAKLASENDRPAFAALELMLIRTLANTLAEHGQSLVRIDSITSRTEAELISIKAELASLRESLATLPTRLGSRLDLPDLQSFDSLRVSANQTGLIVPRAVASLDTRLAGIETLLRATFEVATETRDVQRGDRKLLARLPLVGEPIRDNANREWTTRELFSTGPAGCVALAEHRGKLTVFKISLIEEFARSFAREVEAATTLQDIQAEHARFCKILDSKLPIRRKAGDAIAEAAVLPPYWIQLEHFPLGNLAMWWKAAAPTGAEQAERAAALVTDIARTVEIAHAQRVLHRDLKPANILMRESVRGAVVPHVSDFGIASFTDPERSAALQEHAGGRTIHTKGMDAASHQGTLLYMAPELYERSADNRPPPSPSARTDVYSLGMILYWLLTGRQERPSRELVQTHVADRVLGYVIRRATHREPERRYASAAALAAELDARAALIPRLTELEDALLSDSDRLALEKERLQASEEQRARAEREKARAEEQSARALRLVGRLRWAAAGLVALATLAMLGFVIASKRAEGERLAKIDADEKRVLADRETERAKIETAKAETERLKAIAAGERIEYNSYVANVEMAAAAMDFRQFDRVRQRLDACPPRLRGWEWGWLDTTADNSLTQLKGHTHRVTSAAFSPDGTRIVTESHDITARVWDAATGASLAELKGHTDLLLSAAFSPDGTRIATASADSTARVWDAARGASLAELKGHTGPVSSAAFSPDGTRIVTASEDYTARVWDVATGATLAELKGHKGDVYSASFSPDGTRIVTASWDGTARVWDAASGTRMAELKGHALWVRSAAFSPDGTRIVTVSGDNTARVWDAARGASLAELNGHEDSVRSAAFSPDGTRVVTASLDSTARVWNAATGQEVALLRGHEGWVNSATFSPDGTRIATASDDMTARVWDAARGASLAALKCHTENVYRASFSPDGTRIVTGSGDGAAQVWDAATGASLVELKGHTSSVRSAAFSPDGTRIVTASNDSTARVWDAASGASLAELTGHKWEVSSASFSPDGTRIVTASNYGTARVWDAASGTRIAEFKGHTMWIRSAAFSPDGTRIVTVSGDNTARVWDAASGTSLVELKGHTDPLCSASFSPDGTRIVTGSGDGAARVWDAATGVSLVELKGHTHYVHSASFSPDGTRIVTASWDNTARVWDATTGTTLTELKGHTHYVHSASFSPDGTRIVTASSDKTARVWDAATGTSLAELKGHMGLVLSASFSPDGTRIVTASDDNTARVWDSVPWRERFKELQARGLRK